MLFVRSIKFVFFSILTLLAIAGTYFVEQNAVLAVVQQGSEFILDYSRENVLFDRAVLRFKTDVVKPDIQVVENKDLQAVYQVNAGDFWANFRSADAKVNFLIGDKLVLVPNHAVFHLSYEGSRAQISVFEGDVYLGLLNKGVRTSGFEDRYSDTFMNRFVVPQDTHVDVYLERIDERMATLLYSKLVKELRQSTITGVEKNSDFVKENIKRDRMFLSNLKKQISGDVFYSGKTVSTGVVSRFIFWTRENLTFVEKKSKVLAYDHLFAFLDNAIFYANKGDEVQSQLYLQNFDNYLATLPDVIVSGDKFFERYDTYLRDLAIFSISDPQYFLFLELLNRKFDRERDRYEILDDLWFDVYDAMDLSSILAEKALNEYYRHFDKILAITDNLNFFKKYLAYNNQLFDNLFLRYPTFYKENYFKIKEVLEKKYLGLFIDENLKTEISQDFISSKIDYLRRLTKFFFEDDVSVDEAKGIIALLVGEIDDLMPGDSQAAVTDLFNRELNDIADFWGYLKSPEYNSSKSYGLTQKDRYEVYLHDRNQVWSFVNIQQEVLGQDFRQEQTVTDVRKEIEDTLGEKDGITNLVVGEISDINQRYVDVQASIMGYPFKASYDRHYDSLKDVYAYGELVSDRLLKVASLADLIKAKFAAQNLPEPILQNQQQNIETTAQRLVRIYIVNKIASFNFVIDESKVALVDDKNAIYHVAQIKLKDKDMVTVSFDFAANREWVTNLQFFMDGQTQQIDGQYTLQQLVDMIIAGSSTPISR